MSKFVVRTSQLFRMWAVLGAVVLATVLLFLLSPLKVDAAATLPPGFQESVVFSGLIAPTNVEFSKDGRVFVAEKRGVIKVFDNLSDTTPTTFADLRTQVQNYSDRGLLGLAVDPEFPTNPYVYVSYTHDAPIGGTAPRWGDTCPNPPGGTTDGCVVSSHLSRLQADVTTNTMTGPEQVLIEDWCQQYPSHSAGDLAFGPDGALYVSHGEGASFTFWDYGQGGGSTADSPTPKNPCGDPPTGVDTTLSPPTAEGGSLRSQDLRTGGDPVTLDGAILRVNPATGDALPGNPLISNADPNARRIVAYGERNPFRFTIRPGTNEVWVGNVGGGSTEEIDRVSNPTGSIVQNGGWPCYEGAGRLSQFDSLNVDICENLYAEANAVTAPYYSYTRSQELVAGETTAGCKTGATISGLAFYTTGPYPDEYDDALFFGDYSRSCIWVMQKGANGLPDRAKLKTFVGGAATPVDLEIGPNGDLFYVDIGAGTIRRIQYSSGGNQPPVARATADPTSGPTPLSVSFDGTGSSDPDGDALTYAWDLDGDGAYDDSTSPQPTYTYSTAGTYAARLQVTDARGASDTLDEPLTITAGNTPPTATIDTPVPGTTWKASEGISFSGKGNDGEDGALPASALSWKWIVHHCPTADTCHEHVWEEFPGVASGTFTAPDHEYPSYLELRLTATDSGGLTDTKSVRLDPKTVELNFRSDPAGLKLMVGGSESTTPFSRTAIVGSKNLVSAPSPQALAGTTYNFASWSDGGAQSHEIVAPDAAAATYTATYTPAATQSVSLANSADTMILENAPTTNYGATTPLGADGDEPTGTARDKSSLLKWSVSTIPAGSKISSASVTLNVTNSSTQTYQAFGLKQPWAESAATWTLYAAGQPWQIAGANGSLDRDAQAAGTIRPATMGKQTFTLSPALVQSWLDNPQSNNGIIITNTSNTDGFDFSSREATTSSLRPQLDVTYAKPTTTDTTAPAVTNVAPVAGATDVAIATNVEATFSEAMDASTINSSTFTLVKQGASQPVAAEVSYDLATMKATLDPGGEILDLDSSATYIATIKGGASGAKDLAGNPLTEDESWSFTTAAAPPPADTTPPETTIDSGPSGTVTDSSVSFAFSSSEAGSTFECSLDGAAYSACTSPKGYTNLSNGSHTFEVRATDAAGNVDATPASRTFSVDVPAPPQDTTPPETTIDSGPSGTVKPKDATFMFHSSEAGSTFECKLDSGPYSACSSPKRYTGLANGSHTFLVRATDAAGNTDATPASRTWTVRR